MRALAAVVGVLLAGCLGGAPGEPSPEANDGWPAPMDGAEADAPAPADAGTHLAWTPPADRARTTLWLNATLDTDAMSWWGGTADPDGSLHVEVPAAALGLVVELAWDDDLQDLDLNVVSPGWCPSSGEPDSALVEGLLCATDLVGPGGSSAGYWRDDGGIPGDGDSPMRIVVRAEDLARWGCPARGPRDCTWALWAYSDTVIVDLGIRWAVTVFMDAPVPDGFALLAQG